MAERQDTSSNTPGTRFDRFDDSVESFDDYIDRLTAYFDLNNVIQDKKVKILVTALSPKLFSLLKSLLFPKTYTDKTYEELVNILKNHLNPKPLVIPSRFTFINRKQKEGESVSSYIAELRKLSLNCQYSEIFLNTMLRDVFVSGLKRPLHDQYY